MEHIVEKIATGLSEEGLNELFNDSVVVLTGSHGFLGSHLRRYFNYINENILRDKVKVICVDNFITGKTDEDTYGFVNLSQDIRKKITIKGKVDYIIHFSSIASPFYYRKYPLECFETNVMGTKNILELARKKKCKGVLYASSSEIYGDALQVPTLESYKGNVACLGPRAVYDESKRAAECLCECYHNLYGVKVKIVRPFNFYSEGMNQLDFRVLPNFASKVLKDQPIQVYGTGEQTRTLTYASDGIEGCLRVLLLGIDGQPYNICADGEISMYDLAVKLGEIINQEVKIELTPYPDSYPADEPMRRIGDITKARIQLGFNPKIDMVTGIKYFMDWAKENYEF
jgi:UDP-glucuronate decarboxylase